MPTGRVKVQYIHRETKRFTDSIFNTFSEYIHWLDTHRGMVVMRVIPIGA